MTSHRRPARNGSARRSRAVALGLPLLAATLAAELLPEAGALLAVLFSLAVTACWLAGTPRSRLADKLLAAALFLSLAAGSLVAAGALVPGAGLHGLLLGVVAVPLLLTVAGFALRFDPPDPEGLRRLRGEAE